MNKKLLALAVASAVAPLYAHAAGSLNIYGGVGMAVESIDTDVQSALGVNSNHSALGFEGSMELSNGMDAVFHYDTFVNLDGGGDTLFDGGRDGWAGLRGGFGTVALGFQGRPWKTLSHALDPFEGTIADYSSVMGNAGNGSTYFDGGIGHAIIWFGPDMDGLSWHVQYGAEEVEDGANNMGAQIHYSNDMYFVGASFDANDGGSGGTDEEAMKLVGSINLDGGFTVTGAFESISGAGFVDGADRDAFWLAGSYQAGDTRFSLAFATADELDTVDDSGASQASLGIFHNLAENTTVYAIFTSISNDDGGSYRFVSAPHTSSFDSDLYTGGVAGEDSSAVALGIKYNFSADVM